MPQPVIAKVRGYAIGGGNVLATLCDLTIAGESAQLGQVGPKMGSVNPGFGMQALKLYYDSAEPKEGVASFLEKRKPDFRRYAK